MSANTTPSIHCPSQFECEAVDIFTREIKKVAAMPCLEASVEYPSVHARGNVTDISGHEIEYKGVEVASETVSSLEEALHGRDCSTGCALIALMTRSTIANMGCISSFEGLTPAAPASRS